MRGLEWLNGLYLPMDPGLANLRVSHQSLPRVHCLAIPRLTGLLFRAGLHGKGVVRDGAAGIGGVEIEGLVLGDGRGHSKEAVPHFPLREF